MRETGRKYTNLCAPCTFMRRTKVFHEEIQRKKCFKSRCIRCSSSSHNYDSCFAKQFRHTAPGGCSKCSIRMHRHERVHDAGEYGQMGCRYVNCIRLLVLMWESQEWKFQLNMQYKETQALASTEAFVLWLGKEGKEGATPFIHVFEWAIGRLCR